MNVLILYSTYFVHRCLHLCYFYHISCDIFINLSQGNIASSDLQWLFKKVIYCVAFFSRCKMIISLINLFVFWIPEISFIFICTVNDTTLWLRFLPRDSLRCLGLILSGSFVPSVLVRYGSALESLLASGRAVPQGFNPPQRS